MRLRGSFALAILWLALPLGARRGAKVTGYNSGGAPLAPCADVAKLADALDLGSSSRKGV